MNVLSLFDGMSCCHLALDKLGVRPTNYYTAEIDKYAEGVSRYNYPNAIRLGDVTNWKQWDIDWSSINLVTGGFPCSPAGTKVKTVDGYKNIENILVGDKVLTHTNEYKKVVVVMEKIANHINLIQSQGSYNLRLTDEHPLYVVRDGILSWVEAKNLTTDDYLTYNINSKAENTYNLTLVECWLLGRYLADGVLDNEKCLPYFCIGKTKRNVFEEIVSQHYSYYICHEKRSCHEFFIRDKRLYGLAKMCGNGALNKHVPQFILDLPNELLLSFWGGIYIRGRSF